MAHYRKLIIYIFVGLALVALTLLMLSRIGVSVFRTEDPRVTEARVKVMVADLTYYARLKRVNSVVFSVLGAGCVLLLSVGGFRKLSVHSFKLGEFREIKVRWCDMKHVGFIAEGLVLAEQMHERTAGLHELLEAMQAKILHGLQQPRGTKMIDVTPEPPALAAPVPTFRDLLDKGEFGGDMVLGVSHSGELKKLPWDQVISCAFGGESGSGKTSTLRSVASQALLHGGIELHVLDPHEGTPESLNASLGELINLPGVFTCSQFDLANKVNELLQRIEDRKSGEEGIDQRILILVDETQDLVEGCPHAKELISQVGRVTRKYNIYGIFGTQSWPAKMLQGSEVRDNLTMKLAHKMSKRQARTLFDDKDVAQQISKLEPGKVIGRGRTLRSDDVFSVPFCAFADTSVVYQQAVAKQVNGPATLRNVVAPATDTITGVDTALLWKVKQHVNAPGNSLSQFAQQAGINKGTLSKLVKEHRLSESAKEKLTTFFDTHGGVNV